MPTPVLPSTPVARSAPATPTSTPQTGTWRHPKLDEIVKRRNASNFSEKNVKMIMWNVTGLGGIWFVSRLLSYILPWLFQPSKNATPYPSYLYYAFQLVFVYNILFACLPLLRPKDDIEDIPLTPAQRKLLGLPPSSAPPTPGSSYITPPRYARTPTPLSSSPGSKDRYPPDSPLSRKGSPDSGSLMGSPWPGTSPLLQKAVGGGLNSSRRHSYGSPSPLGPGTSRVNLPDTPGTPSPTAAKGVKIGLNSKWLYEKGRRNSGNSRLYS